jgi:hypothetical protein
MKKIIIVSVLAMGALCIQCQKEKDTTFLITNTSVGKLSKTAVFKQLDSIYALDSIVKDTTRTQLGPQTSKVQIYEKGGLHLLTLTPTTDSLQKIENIRIVDPRFVTDKGVGLGSTFKDIKDNYPIKKIVTSMNNVVIFLKGSDLYFTIDKQELPPSLRFAGSANIEEVQIPDAAKIKYLMVGWE